MGYPTHLTTPLVYLKYSDGHEIANRVSAIDHLVTCELGHRRPRSKRPPPLIRNEMHFAHDDALVRSRAVPDIAPRPKALGKYRRDHPTQDLPNQSRAVPPRDQRAPNRPIALPKHIVFPTPKYAGPPLVWDVVALGLRFASKVDLNGFLRTHDIARAVLAYPLVASRVVYHCLLTS